MRWKQRYGWIGLLTAMAMGSAMATTAAPPKGDVLLVPDRVWTADGEALLRKPIRELAAMLDPNVFKQIHRSTIVNLRAVASIVRDDTGKGTLRLKQRPETLVVSQPFMTLFRNM